MKDKTMPVMLVIIILLFIITGLTVLFVNDFYTSFGDEYTDTLYGDTNRSPLYGTKSFDAEAISSAIKKEHAQDAQFYRELYQQFKEDPVTNTAASSMQNAASTMPNTDSTVGKAENTTAHGTTASSAESAQTAGAATADNTAKLYVVYTQSLAGGGI